MRDIEKVFLGVVWNEHFKSKSLYYEYVQGFRVFYIFGYFKFMFVDEHITSDFRVKEK